VRRNKYVYAYFVAVALAVTLNILHIVAVIGFVAVQIGGCTVALTILINLVPFRKEKDSPVDYRNWKKNPLLAVVFCVLSLAFIVSLAIAVFSMG